MSETKEGSEMAPELPPIKIVRGHFIGGDKELPTPRCEIAVTEAHLREIAKCATDIIYFAENYFYIENMDEGEMKIKLYPAQKRVLRAMVENRFTCVRASRQIGKSTMTQIFVLWTICFKQNQKVSILANKEATAISIVDRIQLAYRRLPIWLKPGVEDWSKKSFSLDETNNRSRVSSAPTSKDAIRGISCNLLILDEAAFIDPSICDIFWEAVFPTITSAKTSKCFMVSTPNGVHNLFYKTFTAAMTDPNSPWHAETIYWHDVPGRDEEWAKMTRGALGSEDSWQQEFESSVGTTRLDVEDRPDLSDLVSVWDELLAA